MIRLEIKKRVVVILMIQILDNSMMLKMIQIGFGVKVKKRK